MDLQDNLKRATALKRELDDLRPLSPEQEKRIMQKFRLDWNYHSSKIEGNSLTYGETKALLLFNHTAQAKPLKDHLEMSGHDEAIKSIEEVVKQQRPLTETFIRELHKIILKQPYQVDAVTADGEPTKKWINIGMYKISPNHVKTKTGEMFYFATPEETPAMMADLMLWFKEESNKKVIHPVVFATEFHYRFIRIHPFDDGNGRIARLLMNFVLMQKGYPPAIIRTEEKSRYYQALEQADAGQLDFFFNFVCEQVNFSLDLMLRAARGEDIEDADDLDKKLQLLKMKLENEPDSKIKIKKSPAAVKKIIDNSIKPLVKTLENQLTKFDSLFKSRNSNIKYGNSYVADDDFVKALNRIYSTTIEKELDKNVPVRELIFESTFNSLINQGVDISVKGINFSVLFHKNVYEIKGSGIKRNLSKLYDNFFSEEDINHIVSQLCNWQYNELEKRISENLK